MILSCKMSFDKTKFSVFILSDRITSHFLQDLINMSSHITIQIRNYDIAVSKILRFTLLNSEIVKLR